MTSIEVEEGQVVEEEEALAEEVQEEEVTTPEEEDGVGSEKSARRNTLGMKQEP